MFVRMLTMNVKPGQRSGLATLIEEKHIPLLRSFAGFRDQISWLSPDGKQAVLISFWDTAAQAEVYARDGYASVLAVTQPFIDSTPVLCTYDVIFSTAYQIRASAAGV